LSKFKVFFLPCCLVLAGCILDEDESSKNVTSGQTLTEAITGIVEKGPFQLGSVIKVTELDEDLQKTENFFISVTYDDLGNYRIPVSITSGFIKVEATGKPFNELTNTISSDNITLTAYSDLREGSEVNINVLTHLASQRTLELVIKQGFAFDEATQLAENTVLSELGLKQNLAAPFHRLQLNENSIDNRELLGASAFILSTASELPSVGLEELLDRMAMELESGQLGTSTRLEYEKGLQESDIESFKNNLSSYLINIEVTPNFPETAGLPMPITTRPVAVLKEDNLIGPIGQLIVMTAEQSHNINYSVLRYQWHSYPFSNGDSITISDCCPIIASILGEEKTNEIIPSSTNFTLYSLSVADGIFNFPDVMNTYTDTPQIKYFRIAGFHTHTVNGDGTVIGSDGKLWQQVDDGQLYSAKTDIAIQTDVTKTANYYCDNLVLGGKTDWVVPHKSDLRNLVDLRFNSPKIDPQAFPNTKFDHPYITTHRTGNVTQYGVNFNTGEDQTENAASLKFYVRCLSP